MYKKNLVNQFEVSVIFLEFSEAYNPTKGYNSPTASNYIPDMKFLFDFYISKKFEPGNKQSGSRQGYHFQGNNWFFNFIIFFFEFYSFS